MEMCKQNESRIEELVMENAKLKLQLSAVDRNSLSYDVREGSHTDRHNSRRFLFNIIIHL